MELKDIDDNKIPLFFYTKDRGRELAPSLVQEEYTVAILYAQRHNFLNSEEGIRLEEPKNIKVPLPQIPQYSFTFLTKHAHADISTTTK
jgi:hypothetical protein